MKRFTNLLVALATFALAASVASAAAGVLPDDRATRGPGAFAVEVTSVPTRPNDRASHGPGAFASGTAGDVIRPDDRSWRGPGPVPVVEVSSGPQLRADGFDWADAGIGAAGALGIALLLAGLSALVVRRERVTALT